MFWVYVIKNENNKIYIGQTSDLSKRLKRHNNILINSKKSYTSKNKGNWEVIYKEEFNTRKEALKIEKYLKSHHGRNWLKHLWARSSTVEQ